MKRQSLPVPPQRPERSRLKLTPTGVAALYVVLLMVVTAFASHQLYHWARLRMLGMSPLPQLEAISQEAAQATDTAAQDDDRVASPAGQPLAANDAPVDAAPPVPAINVLLLGTDARPDDPSSPRTDTMIVLTLDPNSQTAGILSLPRDLWVPIPGSGVSSKINMAYVIGEDQAYPGGGAQLAKDTVSSFIGQPVPYYARVNFRGFEEIIDLIGGIEIVVPVTIHDEAYPTADYGVETFHLDAGPQHLDGETALKYVRTRNVDSDYGRARRQQQVIRAVADKVLRADMVPTLLAKAPQLFYTMRSSIQTDLPMAAQFELATYMRTAALREIRQLVLDDQYGTETYSEEGAWILMPDRAKVRSAMAAFFDTTVLPSSASEAVAQANPSWVRVEILNGTDTPGVAARTRELLEAQGWHVVSIGDADRSDYGRTIVINYGVPTELVQKVGADLELDPQLSSLNGLNVSSPVDMRIVVGSDILPRIK